MGTWDIAEFNSTLDAAMTNVGVGSRGRLAALTGISPQQFSIWRKGTARPSLDSARRVAPALGVRPVDVWRWAGYITLADLITQGAIENGPIRVTQLARLHQMLRGRDLDGMTQRVSWVLERALIARRHTQVEKPAPHTRGGEATWDPVYFNTELESAMAAAGIATRERLAELSDVTPVGLSSWRHGTSRPTPDSLEKLTTALHIPPARLWEWAGYLTGQDLTVPAGYTDLPLLLQQVATIYGEASADERADLDRHLDFLLDTYLDQEAAPAPRRRPAAS